MAKFKREILEQMKNDPALHAVVASAMGVKPTSLGPIINRNGNSLNQYNVVAAVAEHLGKLPSDILEPEPVGAD